ncbi:MAG: sporulation protein YabP [Clostridia bacterium]|nr:sporulation protein YabP [Clostridia bacterium]
MSDENRGMTHSLILQERKMLTVSGVSEVKGFSERAVVAETVLGELTLKGEELRITGFNRETGDMAVEGKITALAYTGDGSGGGFWGRVFK